MLSGRCHCSLQAVCLPPFVARAWCCIPLALPCATTTTSMWSRCSSLSFFLWCFVQAGSSWMRLSITLCEVSQVSFPALASCASESKSWQWRKVWWPHRKKGAKIQLKLPVMISRLLAPLDCQQLTLSIPKALVKGKMLRISRKDKHKFRKSKEYSVIRKYLTHPIRLIAKIAQLLLWRQHPKLCFLSKKR